MKRSLRKMLRPGEKKEPPGVVYQGVEDDMDDSEDSFKVPWAVGRAPKSGGGSACLNLALCVSRFLAGGPGMEGRGRSGMRAAHLGACVRDQRGPSPKVGHTAKWLYRPAIRCLGLGSILVLWSETEEPTPALRRYREWQEWRVPPGHRGVGKDCGGRDPLNMGRGLPRAPKGWDGASVSCEVPGAFSPKGSTTQRYRLRAQSEGTGCWGLRKLAGGVSSRCLQEERGLFKR